LFQELNDRPSALVAFRRRSYMMGWPRYLATARREEAELAASMGDTAIARASLARYLALRRNPEPQLATVRDTVRQHVAAAYAGVDQERQESGASKKRSFVRGGRSRSAARRAGFDR